MKSSGAMSAHSLTFTHLPFGFGSGICISSISSKLMKVASEDVIYYVVLLSEVSAKSSFSEM
jgi:hypothetical protein